MTDQTTIIISRDKLQAALDALVSLNQEVDKEIYAGYGKEIQELRIVLAPQPVAPVQAELQSEALKLAPILRNMCEGGGIDRDFDIYAESYQAGDGDTYVIRAAEFLEDFAALATQQPAVQPIAYTTPTVIAELAQKLGGENGGVTANLAHSRGHHWQIPIYAAPQPSVGVTLSDAEIEAAVRKVDDLAMDHGLAESQMPKAVAIIRALFSGEKP